MIPEDPPPIVAIDAEGYWWRRYDTHWSMVPTNPDNSPVPRPVKFYRLVEIGIVSDEGELEIGTAP